MPVRLLSCFAVVLACGALRAADTPPIDLALKFRPVQKDVEYETPPASEFANCRVEVERQGKSSGWIVYGPAGQILRRFVDTDGDNVVDQWRYFQHGIEVYRDLDTNANNKVDQSRWLNAGGSRWGIDSNEDGRIDSWKSLSAAEATRAAINAMVAGDEAALEMLLVDKVDLRALGVNAALSEKMLEAVANPGPRMREVLRSSKALNSQSQWMRFDALMPSAIPADSGKADSDLMVYENAMAIVETNGESNLVQIGEMLRVGAVWKLTQVPAPLEGNSVQVAYGGILMQPALESVGGGGSASDSVVNPEMQQVLDRLQQLDKESARAAAGGGRALADYNAQRSELLAQLVSLSKTEEDKTQWMRQRVDGLAAAVQTGAFPDGLEQLASIEARVRRSSPNSPLLPYVSYRKLLAEYSSRLQAAKTEDRGELQKWWVEQLEQFVEKHPEAEDAADATLQLAITEEFSGRVDEALAWYRKLVGRYPKTDAARRGNGALRRLDLEGKKLALSGPGLNEGTIDVAAYRGKVLLVSYWATWCQPCTEDLPEIRALYEQYKSRGFEIVGVNLDATREPIEPYLSQYRVTWPQIHQPGGLESEAAIAFGVISLPTSFLVDKDGAVVSRAASVEILKTQLPELLKE